MAKETKELSVQESRELLLNPVFQTVKRFEVQQRMANMYVQSTVLPDTFKGNIGNCVIAIDMAMRMQVNPLMVMQNLYIVHGMPSWSSKFLISCINASGRFTPLRYQFYGKRGSAEYACRAYAYEKSDKEHKEPLCGIWVTMAMADKEGWTKKNGSKWLTMPDQMLIYRAAAFWQRAYAPEISMGFITKEEAEDAVQPEDITVMEAAAKEFPEPIIDQAPFVPTEDAAAENTESDEAHAQTPADAVANALRKQPKTNYRTPQTATADGDKRIAVDKETGELFPPESSEHTAVPYPTEEE